MLHSHFVGFVTRQLKFAVSSYHKNKVASVLRVQLFLNLFISQYFKSSNGFSHVVFS